MHIVGFVKPVFNLTSFCIVDCLNNIHCNSSALWVWHQTFWSQNSCNSSHNAHHVWSCNADIKIKPSTLNFCNNFFCANIICTSFCSCISLVAFCNNQNFQAFACSVWQNAHTTHLLVSISSINAKSNVKFNCFIKFCFWQTQESFKRTVNIESFLSYNFKCLSISFSCFHNASLVNNADAHAFCGAFNHAHS